MKQDELESKVIEMMLAGNCAVFKKLRVQYEAISVIKREFTGRGFFTTFGVPDELRLDGGIHGKIDDVVARFGLPGEEMLNEAYYFMLYIEDGKIDALEGFATLGPWKKNYDDARIEYGYKDKREFELQTENGCITSCPMEESD